MRFESLPLPVCQISSCHAKSVPAHALCKHALADIDVVPLWLAAFVVGILVAAVGYFLIRKGLDALKQEDMAPRQTMETLKEDQQWIKDQKR
jgi:hypothetical protein